MRIIFRILLTYTQICIKISIMTDSKEMIKKLGLTPNKALGQNFLIDTHVLEKIIEASKITKDDFVLEIGPGIGTMTQYLAEAAREAGLNF